MPLKDGIRFFIMAVPNFAGHLRVLEYYECNMVYTDKSNSNEARAGRVDDAIIKQHGKDYQVFKEVLDKNEAKLFEQARAKPNTPVYFVYPEPVEPDRETLEQIEEETNEEINNAISTIVSDN